MVASGSESDDVSLAPSICHEALLRSYYTLHSLQGRSQDLQKGGAKYIKGARAKRAKTKKKKKIRLTTPTNCVT